MKSIRIPAVITLAALFLAALAPNARAGMFDKETIVTFSQPVEVPGLVLPAGTYVLDRLEGFSHVVRIFNANESHVLATFLTVPEYLLQPVDKPVITFEERAKGLPELVQAWFYPGDTVGEKFLYAKSTVQKDRGGNE